MGTVLSLDQSTAHCSAAVARDTGILAEDSWNSRNIRNQDLFRVLPEMLKETGLSLCEIDIYAVGTGPGSFAGIRTAISAMNGFALPDKKPVMGISCGEAVASDILQTANGQIATVVGDARRNRLWYAQFEKDGETVKTTKDYSLATKEEFPSLLPEDSILATPDWERLEGYLKQTIPGTIEVIAKQQSPKATTVARLALSTSQIANCKLQTASPIYMHPPVRKEKA